MILNPSFLRRHLFSFVYLGTLMISGISFSGCASVKPYQREQLSSPTMQMPSGGPEFAARNRFLGIAGEKFASSGKGAGSAACATCSK